MTAQDTDNGKSFFIRDESRTLEPNRVRLTQSRDPSDCFDIRFTPSGLTALCDRTLTPSCLLS